MSDGESDVGIPLASSPSEVRQVPECPATEGQSPWRVDVRFGARGRGGLACDVVGPPPTLRRVGVRGILDVPPFTWQVGYLASMNADA